MAPTSHKRGLFPHGLTHTANAFFAREYKNNSTPFFTLSALSAAPRTTSPMMLQNTRKARVTRKATCCARNLFSKDIYHYLFSAPTVYEFGFSTQRGDL
jgi:hypothetical protein